jgi:hypothetical protein
MFDENCKKEARTVPDTKKVLPCIRRKVLENKCLVLSGLTPVIEPYLIAKSLGAVVMNKVTEKTTHLIASHETPEVI